MGNGGMQPTYGPFTDNTFKTVGGNTTIINACECDALATSWESVQVEVSPLGEDDSHVMGEWANGIADFAGS
jgi:hypothetical protein